MESFQTVSPIGVREDGAPQDHILRRERNGLSVLVQSQSTNKSVDIFIRLLALNASCE